MSGTIRVDKAMPKTYGCLDAHSGARNVLLRQFRFPNEYDPELDRMESGDHDRVAQGDKPRWQGATKSIQPLLKGFSLAYWFQNGKVADIKRFLMVVLDAEHEVNWTGFRVTATINRATGWPVYHLALFGKGVGSKTKAYTGEKAPNVISFDDGRGCYLHLRG